MSELAGLLICTPGAGCVPQDSWELGESELAGASPLSFLPIHAYLMLYKYPLSLLG